jgi:hypothetical protein
MALDDAKREKKAIKVQHTAELKGFGPTMHLSKEPSSLQEMGQAPRQPDRREGEHPISATIGMTAGKTFAAKAPGEC